MNKLTEEEVLAISLPKWPGLLVTGRCVSLEQAAEIIIRTNSDTHLGTNDRGWQKLLMSFLGIPADDDGFYPKDYEHADAVWKALGHLDLEYMVNDRIVSAYVYGPHGWINWDGTVGCSTFNIGKWPSTEAVFADLVKIAKAWPYLSLRIQLLNEENGVDTVHVPLIEYHVEGGRVEAYKPIKLLSEAYAVEGRQGKDVLNILQPGRERGCTIEKFKWALDVTRRAVAKEREGVQTSEKEP